MSENPEWLRIADVAKRYKLSKAWVAVLVREKKIPSVKFGSRAVRIPADALEQFVQSQLAACLKK